MNRRNLMTLGAVGAPAMLAGAGPAVGGGHAVQAAGAVTRDGARLFLRRWGAGRPVLFLSGWTLPSDFWCYQMARLAAEGFETLAYDRRGHGRSDDPGSGYEHDTLADDLAAVIQAFGRDELIVVGHSMAATEIARYFSRHGGAGVAGVVLVSPITPFLMKTEDNPAGLDRDILRSLRAPLLRDFPEWIDQNAAPFFVPETSAGMIEWGKALMLQTSLQAALELARLNAETDFRGDVAAISAPTLIIHGDRDASAPVPLTAQPTHRLIRSSELRIYEGAPHGLPLTHVDRLSADLSTFAGTLG